MIYLKYFFVGDKLDLCDVVLKGLREKFGVKCGSFRLRNWSLIWGRR